VFTLAFELPNAVGSGCIENAGAGPALQSILEGPKHDAISVVDRAALRKENLS
jgi:hypothetical protein